jgi:hypothetical protein
MKTFLGDYRITTDTEGRRLLCKPTHARVLPEDLDLATFKARYKRFCRSVVAAAALAMAATVAAPFLVLLGWHFDPSFRWLINPFLVLGVALSLLSLWLTLTSRRWELVFPPPLPPELAISPRGWIARKTQAPSRMLWASLVPWLASTPRAWISFEKVWLSIGLGLSMLYYVVIATILPLLFMPTFHPSVWFARIVAAGWVIGLASLAWGVLLYRRRKTARA